jgi:hypothetical protein
VAKGTIVSTNSDTLLGGVPLGKEYCEVIVNTVLNRDAILPCPYGYVEIIADAHQMRVDWLYKRVMSYSSPLLLLFAYVMSDKTL